MRNLRKNIFFIAVFAFAVAIPAIAQTQTFSDPNIEFTFEIPDERWKIIERSPLVELNFGTEREGNLEIRKLSYPASKPLSDVIREEGEVKLQFQPGFVSGKEENFNGALRGAVYNYEFVRSGRKMSGRFYFLRSGDTVYVLRFTGYTDKIRSLRTQTDLMARTFKLK